MNGAMRDPGCPVVKSGGALGALVLLLAATAGPAFSQARQEPFPGEVYRFRVPVNLVLLNVRVSAADGQAPPPLDQGDFTVREDGKAQAIRVFENPQAEARLVLVLDVSGSTRTKIEEIRSSTRQFLDELAEHDEVAVITVGPSYELVQDFTDERRQLRRVARRLGPQVGRGTQLYDGLAKALELVRPYQGRSMVVVFSDGMDTKSEISYSSLRQTVLRGGSAVYALSLNTLEEERQRLEESLKRLAEPKKLVVILDLASERAETRRAIARTARVFLEELQPADRVGVLQYRASQLWLLAERDRPQRARGRLEELGEGEPRGQRVPRRGAAAVGNATLLHEGTGENIVVFTDPERSGVAALDRYLRLGRATILPVRAEKPAALRQRLRQLIYSRIDVERGIVEDLAALPPFFAQSQQRLRQMAEESGGRYFFLQDVNRLAEAYAAIVQELRDTYLLGYYSKAGSGFHPLEVRLKDERLRVRTRRGFFAPFEPER
ncbi:MAG: VWA domain-containing protein [Terriglobia bacterium]